jgi:hypothetical protein
MAMRGRSWLTAAALIAAALVIAVRYDPVPALRGPAPYPPEWQWIHRPRALARARPALPLAAAMVGLLAWSGRAVSRQRPRRTAALLIAGGLGLGFAFPLALLESEDGGAVAHLVRRTASPGYLSYHAVACSFVARDPGAFLRDYPRLLPALPVHAATHPPGPVLFFRGLLGALDRWPALHAFIDRHVAAACDADGTACGANVAGLTPVERSAALAGALAAHSVAVATLLPIAWLAFAFTRDRLAAARTAMVWPLVPAAALFVPALDPALAFPVTLAAAALRHAVAADRSAARLWAALLGGLTAGAAVFFSYGAPVFLLLATAAVLASLPPAMLAARRRALVVALAVATLAAAAAVAAPALVGHDPVASAQAALAIHGDQYTARRSYLLWLVYGPLDLAIFAGPPIVVGLVAAAAAAVRTRAGTLAPPARLALAVPAALSILFASGLIRGEVGRLLAPMMPWVLLAGLVRLDEEPGPDARTAAVTTAALAGIDVVLRLNWRL